MNYRLLLLVVFTVVAVTQAGCTGANPPAQAPAPADTTAGEQPAAYPPADAGYPAPETGAANSGAANSGAAYPGAAYPDAASSVAALPGAAYPGAAYPGAAYPGAAYPGAAYPGAVDPALQAGATNPGAAYPGIEEPVIIQTAFEAYEITKELAQKWDPTATLYGIPATFKMESSVRNPWTGKGWFFLYKVPTNTLEYYIYVDNGKLQGYTEAQPIVVGERELKYFPLPPFDEMLDSDEVMEVFMQNGGDKYLADHPQAKLNMELLFTNKFPHPVWDIYDFNELETAMVSIFRLNALTGELMAVDE